MLVLQIVTIFAQSLLSPFSGLWVFRGVARGGGAGAPRNLADQLTLFNQGGQIMPLKLLPAPPD